MYTAEHEDYRLIDKSAFFDRAWYLHTHGDVRVANLDPIEHYLSAGAKEGRDPSPLFSTVSYLNRRPDVAKANLNPLVHFLRHGILEVEAQVGAAAAAPSAIDTDYETIRNSSLFDAEWYLSQYPDVRAANLDPIQHYLSTGGQEGRDPSSGFNSLWYSNTSPDVAASGMNPLLHYLIVGSRNGALPKPDNWSYLQQHNIVLPRFGQSIQRDPLRKKIFFVTHDASRTGAPLIIKTLAAYFALNTDCELFTLCAAPGDIIDDFRLYSHVIDCTRFNIFQGSIGLQSLISDLGSNVVLAICNTANVNHFTRALKECGVPTITLVHEKLYAYDKNYVTSMYEASDKIIFPAKFVQSVANARVPLPAGKDAVIPQGLLVRSFGSQVGEDVKASIRRELGLPEDSLIVIGCGTVTIRKGVDLFISVAQKCLAATDENLHFVWLGSRTADSGFDYWSSKDIQASGHSERIHLVGERADPAPYYKAADLFLLTSREDPFPCVVHEAMACELPVVVFAGAGGAPEALEDGCGVAVPYRDVDGMAEAVISLVTDTERRRAMGTAARSRVEKAYDFQNYFSSIVRLAEDDLGISFGPVHRGRSAPDRPKVLFFNRDWWISGVNSFAETLIKGLIANGVDAELIFPEFPASDTSFLPDVPHRFLHLEGMPHDKQWQVLREFCEAQSPCIIVPNYDYMTSAICPTLSDQVGIIGIVHSDDIEHYDHTNRLGRYWNRIICSTQYLSEKLTAINPLFSEKSDVIPYGIPVSPELVSRTTKSGDPLKIVFCARLMQQQKRVLDLIKITNELDRRSVSYRLTVIGEGSEAPVLEAAWRDHIATGSVVMTGRLSREDMLLELAKNDVFLLVSQFEGMPISLIEAMARGLVPVVSDIPAGIPELVLPGKTGFKARVGNAPEFAAHLMTLAQDRSLLTRLSQAAYDHVRLNGFTEEAMTQSYLRVIHAIWLDIQNRSYKRPDAITWRMPGGNVSPPGFALKLVGN